MSRIVSNLLFSLVVYLFCWVHVSLANHSLHEESRRTNLKEASAFGDATTTNERQGAQQQQEYPRASAPSTRRQLSPVDASSTRVVLSYPLDGCMPSRSMNTDVNRYPMLLGENIRESVLKDLSLRVGEFMHKEGVLTGQEAAAGPDQEQSVRSVPLESKYLSSLQMEVTSVPVGMKDHELASLADNLDCVEKVYLDSNKYAFLDPDSQALDEEKTYHDDKNGENSGPIFPLPNLLKFLQPTEAPAADARRLGSAKLDAEKVIKAFEEDVSLCEVDRRLCPSHANPESKSVEQEDIIGFAARPTDAQYGMQWSLRADEPMSTQTEKVWPWWTGVAGPITVAVIDSGCDLAHPDLKNKLWKNTGEICDDGIDNDGNGFVDDCHGYDFANNDNNPAAERSGHGTGAAGVIAAESNNGKGIAGVCWGCTIMCLKFIGNGQGKVSNQVQAIDYAVKNGAKISNNSYGGYGHSSLEFDAIQRAQLAGHLFVTSAGNNNLDTDDPKNDHTPSVYDLHNIVAVGAIDERGDKARFSNFGKKSVDVVAPGVNIRTIERGGRYATVSGTSFAAPAAAGAAGLIWSAFPGLSFIQVKQALVDGCLTHFVDPSVKDLSLCRGRMNAHRSLYAAALMDSGKYPGHDVLAENGGLRPSSKLARKTSETPSSSVASPAVSALTNSFRLVKPGVAAADAAAPTPYPLDTFVNIFSSLFGMP